MKVSKGAFLNPRFTGRIKQTLGLDTDVSTWYSYRYLTLGRKDSTSQTIIQFRNYYFLKV